MTETECDTVAIEAVLESCCDRYQVSMFTPEVHAAQYRMALDGIRALRADLTAAAKRIAELEAALKEACDEYEYAAKYKGDYLATKHEDAATLARLRAARGGGIDGS